MRRRKGKHAEVMRTRAAEESLYKLSLLREAVAKHGWDIAQRSRRRGHIRYRGVDLAQWVISRRVAYRTGTIQDFLVPLLEAIPGWTWDPVRDRHRANIDNLRVLVRRRGWDALARGTTIDGVDLDQWVRVRRTEYRRGTIPKWIAKALEAIPGWSWEPDADGYRSWLRTLRDHVKRDGWDELRLHTVARGGAKLGRWVNSVRERRRKGTLPAWVAAELERMPGWTWDALRDRHAKKLAVLRRFVAKHGWDALTRTTVVEGVELGRWLVYCRDRYVAGTISDELASSLAAIPGWCWRTRRAHGRRGRVGPNRRIGSERHR